MFSAKDLVFAKGPAGGYTIAKSLRFRSSASAYLSRTPGSAGNRTTWTWSGWVKRGKLGASQSLFGAGLTSVGSGSTYMTGLIFTASDQLGFYWASSGGTVANTTAVYRDPSAWYHIVAVANSTTFLIYVNGSQVLSNAISGSGAVNSAVIHALGAFWDTGGSVPYINNDCYLAEINFIDGQALDPTYFGQTDTATGVWMPKKYTGTYGTNGFYLNFSDASGATATTIGKDSSGNGNNWTPNNISVTAGVTYDSMVDTPTNYDNGGNGAGNYCVLNPLSFNSSNVVDGNLAYLGANNTSTRATFATPTSGKWYWELTPVNASPNYVGFGLMGASTTGSNNYGTAAAGLWGLYPTTTMYLSINGSAVNTTVSTPTLGVVFAAAYDADTGNFWIGYASSGSGSPTWFNSTGGTTGNPATGANPMATIAAQTLFPAVSGNNTTSDKSAINFGQRPFALTVPAGFKALCTQNLPTPTIGATSSTNAASYMNAVTYTGTGSSQAIIASATNSGNNPLAITFQPDFVWIKARNHADDHNLFDAVRGALLDLRSDTTAAEITAANTLTSFNSDGYSLGSDASHYGVNAGTDTYVSWQWKANGSGSSNTSGTITSTVSASVASGFSVATFTTPSTFTNATVGHGLGVAPKMIIVKSTTNTGDWVTWHTSLGTNGYLTLNTTSNSGSNSGAFNGTSSTTWTMGSNTWWQASARTWVAYCFAEVAGYSKFGSYTGNGSADGPFVYCGFRPKYIMVKNASTGGAGYNWIISDATRQTYNNTSTDPALWPNLSDAESTGWGFDILSNGFKMRNAAAGANGSGNTIIFAAFAESPFNYARAR